MAQSEKRKKALAFLQFENITNFEVIHSVISSSICKLPISEVCSACAKWIDFGSMVALYIVFLHTYLHKNDFVLWIVIYMYNYRVFIYLYSQKTDKSSSADDNKKLMWQNYCTVIHYAFTNMHNQPIHTKYIHSDLVSPQFSLLY